MIKIDNVLNYIPKTIIEDLGDNDQLLSYAAQGYKLLKIPGTQNVKDADIFEVVNHKVELPREAITLTSAKYYREPFTDWTYYLTRADYYSGDNLLQKDTTVTYQQYQNQQGNSLQWTKTGILQDVLLFTNGNYDTAFTINGNYLIVTNHVNGNNYVVVNTQNVYIAPNEEGARFYDDALVTSQSFVQPQFDRIRIIKGKTSRHALCTTCPPAVVEHGKTLEFSFATGTVELEYTVPFTDLDNNIIIPEEPHVLWLYLAKYAECEYLRNKMLRSPEAGNDGYYKQRSWMNLTQMAESQKFALYDATRTQVVLRNYNFELHYQLQFGQMRLAKLPTYLNTKWAQRYSDPSYYSGRNYNNQLL
jgi:hypothetical protein